MAVNKFDGLTDKEIVDFLTSLEPEETALLIQAIRDFDSSMKHIYEGVNNSVEIIDRKNIFFATIDGASVYPREIVVYEYLNKLCSTSFLRGMMTMKKINDGKSKE